MNLSAPSDEAYRQAGVDLRQAGAVVEIARRAAARTSSRAKIGGIGGFSGAFELPADIRQPVLLSACDGVGTKLKLAIDSGIHDTVGIDLVAMNVNDILATGGEPLVFLDYVATGKIRPEIFQAILDGIAEGCRQAGCALTGGETAEMPGFYPGGEYDLAGFCVGVAEKENLYPRTEDIREGDVLIGLASSGFHSNGYSLVRKIIADQKLDLGEHLEGTDKTLLQAVLEPTRIYVRPVLDLLKAHPTAVRAMAHITGGGFQENIPRMLPEDFSVAVEASAWQWPPLFRHFQQAAGLDDATMLNTFNCGIGFVLLVDPALAQTVTAHLADREPTWNPVKLGEVRHTPGNREVILQ